MSYTIVAPKYFSDAPNFEYACPTCGAGFLVPDQSTFKKVEPPYSKSQHRDSDWEPDWVTFRFSVNCVCNKKECGEVAFVSGGGYVDHCYLEGGHSEYYENFVIKSFFPSPKLCYLPVETPVEVKKLLEKSFALYWVNVSAAANALRASLEALLNVLKVPTQKKLSKGGTVRMSLHHRLDVWADTNKSHADLCFALKEVGNLGSHGDTVRTKHYLGSLEIYSHILKELFENDSKKMKELAKSIRNDIKTKNH